MTEPNVSLLSLPHHDPSVRYVSNPTPSPGEVVVVSVDVPAASGFDEWLLRTPEDGEVRWIEPFEVEPTSTGATWRFRLPCLNPTVSYRFWCRRSNGARSAQWLTGIGLVDYDPLDHFDFRLVTIGRTPAWVPETVWYQIFPDRFASSGRHRGECPDWADPAEWNDAVATGPPAMTQLYGGDLDGIVEHLDHLVDLGVGAIYLNPIFPAQSNHRYDATTFDAVDPILGGDDALVRLREACDQRGLRLIADLTLNHTGKGHDWFRRAQSEPESVEAGFYYFDDHPHDYESWLGISSLPKLDHASAELQTRFYGGPDSVVARYLKPPFDLDGWRIDVANMTGRHGLVDHNAMVRQTTRATVDAVDPDKWIVAEHFFDPSADAVGDGWHGVMNYAGVARPIVSWLGEFSTLAAMMPGPGQDPRDGVAVAQAMDQVRASLPWDVVLGSMVLLGSHDTARWQSMARSPKLARVGFGLLLALPGSPCFLYGDEIGLTGENAEKARRTMPWDRDTWEEDLLDHHRDLVRLRSGSSALAVGGFRWAERAPDALCFLRESRDERLLIRATRAETEPLRLPLAALGIAGTELVIGNGTGHIEGADLILDTDDPASFGVWKL